MVQMGQDLMGGVIHLQSLHGGQPDSQAGRAAGQPHQPCCVMAIDTGGLLDDPGRDLGVRGPEGQGAAAGPDGGQQPAGRMGDQQQDPARRRLLKSLQYRIGRIDIQIVGGIDDGHPVGCPGRGLGKELRQAAGLVDGDHLARFAVLPVPLQNHQVGVGPRRHELADRILQGGGQGAAGRIAGGA